MGKCGRIKRLFCWAWHRQGHWTQEELDSARARAEELLEKWKVYE